MYCSHFGLQRLPFNNTPDPSFYYSTPDHEEALATLQYATQQRKGFVLVTGEIGAGKTLIGRIFLRQMDANSTTAVISQTNLTGRQLLAAICGEFGLAAPSEATNLELTQRLQEYLVEQFARNRFVVVLLDEAQNLPDQSFEELRMLGNLEADDAKLLQVCILGQPELRERFGQPSMKQLDQRLFRRFHLPSLNRPQTGEYIIHRLGVAGCRNEQLFTADAVERIYAASGGTPRVINQICDNALLTAYGQDAHQIDARVIDLVLERDHSLIIQSPAHANASTAHAPQPANGNIAVRPVPHFSDEVPEADDSIRLAELAIEQTQILQRELAALQSEPDHLSEQVGKIAERQHELHKIVAGATTRWLAAKEKLEEYRKEIQGEIREVIVRCHNTQERLAAMERTTAPAEDLDEIRENHLRETGRLLKLMQSQRDELQNQMDDVQKRWSGSEQELRRLLTQSRNEDRLREVQAECEAATRDVLATVDRHRQGMLDHISGLREQCESAHHRLKDIQGEFERRCSEGDRRVEKLLSDLSTHQEQLSGLRKAIEGWRGNVEGELKRLQDSMAEVRESAESDAQDEMKARQLALAEELRREQSVASANLTQRLDRQEAVVQEFRRTLTEASSNTDRLHQGAIAQLANRTAQLEYTLDDIRQQLRLAESGVQEQIEKLCRRFASTADLSEVQQLQTAQQARIERVTSESQSLQAGVSQLSQHVEAQCTNLHANLGKVREQLDATREQISKVADSRVTPQQLAELRDEHKVTITQLLRQLRGRHRQMRAQYTALSDHYQQLDSNLKRLADEKAPAAELDQLRQAHATETGLLQETLTNHEEQFERLKGQLREQTLSAFTRLEELSAITAREEDLLAIRRDLEQGAQALSESLARQQSGWMKAVGDLRGRMDTTGAEMRLVIEQMASRSELAEVAQRSEQRSGEVLERLDRQGQEQRERLGVLLAEIMAGDERTKAELEAIRAAAAEELERVREGLEQVERQTSKKLIQVVVSVDQARHDAEEQVGQVRQELQQARENVQGEVARVEQAIEEVHRKSAEQSGRIKEEVVRVEQRAIAGIADVEKAVEKVHWKSAEQSGRIKEEVGRVEQRAMEGIAGIEKTIEEVHRKSAEQSGRIKDEVDRVEQRAMEGITGVEKTIEEVHRKSAEQSGRIKEEVDRVEQRAVEGIAGVEKAIDQVFHLTSKQIGEVHERIGLVHTEQKQSDRQLEEQIQTEQQRRDSAIADLNSRWETLRANLEELARDAAPAESVARMEQSLSANVTDLRRELVLSSAEHTSNLRTLVEKVADTAGRVIKLENAPSPYELRLQPQVVASLGDLVKTAEAERTGLTEALERAGAVTAHFRNCSSQVQEIMEDWMSTAGGVREQSEGLRASAEASRGILEAMRKCNAAIDAKLNSQRWRSELDRGESLATRLEQSVTGARTVVQRLETLLADFEVCRSEIEAWDARQKQAEEAGNRLSQLIVQAEKAADSRQRLITAVAKSTTQLVDVIQAARLADETQRPTPRPMPAEPAKPAKGVVPQVAGRIEWPTLHAPLSSK